MGPYLQLAFLGPPYITYLDSVDVTPAAQEEIKLLVEERSLQAQPKKIGLRLGGSSEPPKKPSDTFHEILLLSLNRDPYNGVL